MSIIVPQDFEGGFYAIPNCAAPATAKRIANQIPYVERDYLTKFFGYPFYEAIKDGLNAPTGDLLIFVNKVKEPILYYFYFYWLTYSETILTGTGNVNVNSETGNKTRPTEAMANAYNMAVDLSIEIYEWMQTLPSESGGYFDGDYFNVDYFDDESGSVLKQTPIVMRKTKLIKLLNY